MSASLLNIEQLKNTAKTFVEITEVFPAQDAMGQAQRDLNRYALAALEHGFVPEYLENEKDEVG